MQTNRREFLKIAAGAAGGAMTGNFNQVHAETGKKVAQTTIPRWRGFNLLDMFTMRSKGDWAEDDFRWLRDFGFDFVRLPCCYRLWIEDGDDYKLNEQMLAKLDRAVELGGKYGQHVSINFHRAPGYSVNGEFTEPHNLWKDAEPLKAFCFHWQMLAKRYKGVSKDKLSFDLVNEPANIGSKMSRADVDRVVRAAVKAIREVSPERLVIADGLSWGRETIPEVADLGIAQSTRAYDPMHISHYGASWVNSNDYPDPVWPGNGWDRKRLEQHYAPWIELARKGVGVHCGEGGAYNRTPHNVVLAWLRDALEILTENGIGFAIWNFRGSFGIMDSGRRDITYEDFHGHKLDRKLLSLLQEFS
ncbi:MAG: cellulase family glycosylhydrolase [Sedimentisphaerales bacterium]|nr:cellulase family glycosylhydrolase [Sedimentisphaerales bacterium]